MLVRFHRTPFGLVHVPLRAGECSASRLAECVIDQLGQAIIRHLVLDTLDQARPDAWPMEELLEVQHPDDGSILPQSSGPNLEPGAAVDPGWQQAVDRLFTLDPQVMMVSGPVLPLDMQIPNDAGSAWGFQRIWWHWTPMDDLAGLDKMARALAGHGNVAFRGRIGGGTAGGDLARACLEVLQAGHLCVYEPSAIVWSRTISPPLPTISTHRLWSAPGAVAVRTVELTRGLSPIDDAPNSAEIRLFVMRNGRPLGAIPLVHGGRPVSRARLGDMIVSWLWHKLVKEDWWQIRRALRDRYIPADEPREPPSHHVGTVHSLSVVVATRDRPDDLRRCLTSLIAQETGHRVEIIVVDNNPTSGLTAPVVTAVPGVKLVEEERRGLSYARNAGILASTGDILVTTDDDVVAPPMWLERLTIPFMRADIAIVTGNILPLELETRAQQLFESHVGLGRGFERIEADAHWFKQFRGRAAPIWLLGATANAAFRADLFRDSRVGLFSEELGAGTPTGGGEDVYLMYRALRAGYTLVYEPGAFVWHRHRRDMGELRRQIFGYSQSFVAYQLETLLREHDRRALVHLGVRIPRGYAWRIRERLRGTYHAPWWMTFVEIAGNLSGPVALLRSHRQVQRHV